jgi:hypothetical protein
MTMKRLPAKLKALLHQRDTSTTKGISSLSAFEKEIIKRSQLDIKAGRVHSHAEVMKQAAEWLKKK